MPHSLRAKIKGLRYKGIITDKDCNRLRKALDNEDVLDRVRAEIEQVSFTHYFEYGEYYGEDTRQERIVNFNTVMQIIDKYRSESENKNEKHI